MYLLQIMKFSLLWNNKSNNETKIYHKCTFLKIEIDTKLTTFQKTKSYFVYVSFHAVENSKIIQKDLHE
jgi:hypothetical protein